jgi:hypothetical protein
MQVDRINPCKCDKSNIARLLAFGNSSMESSARYIKDTTFQAKKRNITNVKMCLNLRSVCRPFNDRN